MGLDAPLKMFLLMIITCLGGCKSPDAEDSELPEVTMGGGHTVDVEGGLEGGAEGGREGLEGLEGAHPRYAVQMLELVNRLRASGVSCGADYMGPVSPLSLNSLLDEASLLHAQDMAEQGYFEHESLDGREPWDRMNDVGYTGVAYGENIAAGLPGVGATFDQWVNSPGHCSNMMSPDYSELGVGYYALQGSEYTHYWVQNFAHP